MAMAKSQDTMVWTENMTGMIAQANIFIAKLQMGPFALGAAQAQRQGLEQTFRQPVDLSRAIARSGMSGRKRYMVLLSR